MELPNTDTHRQPFLYAGLVLLAVAVVVELLAANPQASATTIVALEVLVSLLVGAGLSSLVLNPVWRVFKKRS